MSNDGLEFRFCSHPRITVWPFLVEVNFAPRLRWGFQHFRMSLDLSKNQLFQPYKKQEVKKTCFSTSLLANWVKLSLLYKSGSKMTLSAGRSNYTWVVAAQTFLMFTPYLGKMNPFWRAYLWCWHPIFEAICWGLCFQIEQLQYLGVASKTRVCPT